MGDSGGATEVAVPCLMVWGGGGDSGVRPMETPVRIGMEGHRVVGGEGRRGSSTGGDVGSSLKVACSPWMTGACFALPPSTWSWAEHRGSAGRHVLSDHKPERCAGTRELQKQRGSVLGGSDCMARSSQKVCWGARIIKPAGVSEVGVTVCVCVCARARAAVTWHHTLRT